MSQSILVTDGAGYIGSHACKVLARAGKLPNFTGIGSPYEPPERAELVLTGGAKQPQVLADELLALLNARGII